MESCRWSIPTKLIEAMRYSSLEINDCFHIASFIVRNGLEPSLFVNHVKNQKSFTWLKIDLDQFEKLLYECCDDFTYGNLRKNWGTYDIHKRQWVGTSGREDDRIFMWHEVISPHILCRWLYDQFEKNIPKWFEPWLEATKCDGRDVCDCGRSSFHDECE